ncbi:MAG: hypothetical protein ACK4K6_16195, partial [Pseudarthrobacter sp.]
PVLTLNTPADGFRTSETSVLVSGTAKANSGEVRSVRVNGRMLVVDDAGGFSYLVQLSGRSTSILVEVTDTAGNSVSEQRTVFVSDALSGIELTSPADGLVTANPEVTVSGSVGRSGASSVLVNGQQVSVSAHGRFSTTVRLTPGTNRLSVSLPGGAQAVRTVVHSGAPPAVSISSPASGGRVTSEQVTVTGRATTSFGAPASVRVNNLLASVDSGGSFAVTVRLKSGTNVITVTAADRSGTTATASVSVTYEPVRASTGASSDSGTGAGGKKSGETTGGTSGDTSGGTSGGNSPPHDKGGGNDKKEEDQSGGNDSKGNPKK